MDKFIILALLLSLLSGVMLYQWEQLIIESKLDESREDNREE